jgi:hypothetical protein
MDTQVLLRRIIELEARVEALERREKNKLTSTFTITNGGTDRAYDANATSLDEISDVLGTLIADMKVIGLMV